MTHSTISLGLGLGGGKASTSSGRLPSGGAFNTYSVDFDGTDDYMDLGTASALNPTSSLTISACLNVYNKKIQLTER